MEPFSKEEIEKELRRIPETLSLASGNTPVAFMDEVRKTISSMTFTTSSHTRPTR